MSVTPPKNSSEIPRAMGGLEEEYEIVRELGRGGTAVVYLAQDRQLGRDVAIKVIRSTYVEDEEAVARLLREARTVAQLQHPNIVMLYGTRRLDDGSLALIMQYVPGRPLKAVIRAEGPLPFKMTAAILDDVASALAYAHQQRIVHRDIKPENIYLDETVEVARLADFGIARHWDKDAGITLPGMAIGTPTYMSPEQIDGADLDGRSDIYSLGIVGYEMLTGRQPWAGENLYSIIYKQKNESLPRLEDLRPGLPPGVGRAIAGALHKAPEKRWGSPQEFLAALRGGDPTTVAVPEILRAPLDPVEPPEDLAEVLGSVEEEPLPEMDDHAHTIKYVRPTEEELVAAVDEAMLPGPSGEQNPNQDTESRWVAGDTGPSPRSSNAKRWVWSAVIATAAGMVAFFGLRDSFVSPGANPTAEDPIPGTVEVAASDGLGDTPEDPTGGPGEGTSSEGQSALQASLPATFDVQGATILSGTAGTPLDQPVRFRVLRADGTPAINALIEFVVTSGGGSVDPRIGSVDADGFVETRWTLGAESDADVMFAQVPGVTDGPTFEFRASRAGVVAANTPPPSTEPASSDSVTAGVAAAASLAAVSGDGQTAAPGAALPNPVRIRVLDAQGQPVVGAQVVFQPAAGTVTEGTVATDETGVAATGWRLGGTAGAQLLAVRVADDPSVGTQIRATAVAATTAALQPRTALTSGGTHSCSLTGSGDVTCWGGNSDGQLGDGSRTRRSSPRPVADGPSFARLAAGFSTTCGITAEGEAYCWGRNDRGQVGDGTTTARTSPTLVPGGRTFREMSLGFAHTCGITSDNQVFCWGANDSGQLGTGNGTESPTPVAVAGGRRFRSLSVGWNHSCGVSGGQTYCWGSNSNGQLGTGSPAPQNRPVPVALSFGLRSVSAGGTHSCGVSEAGIAYCWGANGFGQLGDATNQDQATPVPVGGSLTFRTVQAGPGHTCGLTTSGEVYCWGRNQFGQLGEGSIVSRNAPARVASDVVFNRLTVSGGHTCARGNDGGLYCWGSNSDGQLGDGTRENRATPVRVR